MPKPTKAQVFEAYLKLLRMTRARASWTSVKDAVAKDGLDVKTFDQGLGPAFDALTETCKNIVELLKLHGLKDGKLDPKWEASLKKHTDGIDAKIKGYKAECDRKAAKHPEQKRGWERLKNALDNANSMADREPREIRIMVKNLQEDRDIEAGIDLTGA
jgi:hypothetical protein